MKLRSKGLGTTERLERIQGKYREWINEMDVCRGTVKLSRQKGGRETGIICELGRRVIITEENKLGKKWMEGCHQGSEAGWFI